MLQAGLLWESDHEETDLCQGAPKEVETFYKSIHSIYQLPTYFYVNVWLWTKYIIKKFKLGPSSVIMFYPNIDNSATVIYQYEVYYFKNYLYSLV